MNYFKIIGVACLLFFGLFLMAIGNFQQEHSGKRTFPFAVNPVKKEFVQEYARFFEKERKRLNMPGAALAIIMDSTILFANGYGYKIAGTKEKVDRNTVFRIGSLSKGFSSIMAGILQDKNKISIEDPVVKYLPDLKFKSETQTTGLSLGHVLSHTSGLQYHAYTNLIERSWSLDNIYKKFSSLKLLGKPGEIYAYQNAAYCLAESAMEKSCDQPFDQLIQDYIFDPLEMKNASVTRAAFLSNDNIAHPHVRGKKGWYQRKVSNKYYNAISAGGVNASILDMAKWMQLLLGNRSDVISDKSLNEVFTPRINTKNRKNYYQRWPGVTDCHYALGWRILNTAHSDIVYHGGQVNNYRSEIAVNQKDQIAICVLTNGKGSFTSRSIPSFTEMYKKYKDRIKAWEMEQKGTLLP